MAEIDTELQENKESEKEPTLYELGYHLLSTLSEEAMPEAVGDLKDRVEKRGGVIVSDQMPRQISLAYSISKIINEKRKYFDTALFGWIKFRMSRGEALELKEELKHNKNVLRCILIKTAEETALPLKKMTFLKSKRPSATETGAEKKRKPEKILSEEELDKTIEGLIVE